MTTITVGLAIAATARTPVVGSGLDFENIREFLRTLGLFHGAIVECPESSGNWIVCGTAWEESALGDGAMVIRSHKIKFDGMRARAIG